MNIKNGYLYISLAIIHFFLLFIAFPAFFQYSGNIMFCNWGDGIKNYFTLASYIQEPIGADGIFKYNSFAYPFGDYVYYTDNTPFFSIPFRWFCHHIHDVSGYAIPAFNAFILCNILISSLLVFYIFKRLLGKNVFSYFLAIVLPWINIQLPRIWEGDFNLSCSVPVLMALVLFMLWQRTENSRPKQVAIGAGMVALIFLSFLMHGYYIAIVSMFLGGMLFFLGLALPKKKHGNASLVACILVPVLALAAALSLLHATDKYLGIRPKGAMLYDWSILKTNFIMLFTHYDFHTLAFPVASTMPMDIEIMVYLGNIGLFAFAGIWVGAVFSATFRVRVFNIQKMFFSDPLKKSIFLSGLLMLIVSFGEYYTSNRNELKIYTPIHWINEINTNYLLLIIALLAVIIYGAVLAINPQARGKLRQTGRDYARHPYKKSGVLLCVALMVFLFIGRYSATVINILNPLFYLHFFTKEVEQFRSLSRFSWPFFWAFYIWVTYTFIQLYFQSGKITKAILLTLFIAVGAIELTDYTIKARGVANNPSLFAENQLEKFKKLNIGFSQYQGILPLPYYNVGSEDYPHTIDDNSEWSLYNMQLSLYSHLPLMACKMSRIPQAHAIALLDFVGNDSLNPELKGNLNNKPILIAFDRTLANDPSQASLCTRDRPETKQYYLKANEFVTRHHITPIDSLENILFYSWLPNGAAPL